MHTLLPLLLLISSLCACGGDDPLGSTTPAAPTCGDAHLDADEICDGAQLGASTCASLGFGVGTLRCNASCDGFDTTACGAPTTCGNGALDAPERCDGAELGGATCTSFGLGTGTLACNASCTDFDTRGCANACTPRACEASACGTVDDGCGASVDCGDTCKTQASWYTCGGGGSANACGATCDFACPTSSTCNEQGVCSYVANADLEVELHQVTVRVLLDGAEPTEQLDCTTPSYVANFSLVNAIAPGGLINDRLLCGTHWTSAPLTLPKGRYQLRLEPRANVSNFPGGRPTIQDIAVIGDGEVVVDVRTARVSGALLRGGVAPLESNCSPGQTVGRLEFYSAISERTDVPVPCGGDFRFDGRVYPGDYRVTFFGAGRSNLQSTRIAATALHIDGDRAIDFDLGDDRAVRGQLTFGGQAPSASARCTPGAAGVRVSFQRDGETTHFLNIPCAGPYTYETQLPPGTYSLFVRNQLNDGLEPPHFNFVDALPPLVVADAPVVYDLDIPTTTVTGRITVNGVAPNETADCTDTLGYVQLDGGVALPIACGGGFRFGPIRMTPGAHSAYIGAAPERSDLRNGTFGSFDVPPAGGEVVLDLPAYYTVTTQLTIDGASVDAACSPGETIAQIDLRSPAFYTSMGLPCGADGAVTFTVPVGQYTIETRSLSGNFPIYLSAPFDVQANVTHAADILTRPLSGRIMLDGALPIETAACTAGLDVAQVVFYRLGSVGSTSAATIACGAGFAFGPVQLGVGVYSVIVRAQGNPARSNLPTYDYVAIPRIAIE